MNILCIYIYITIHIYCTICIYIDSTFKYVLIKIKRSLKIYQFHDNFFFKLSMGYYLFLCIFTRVYVSVFIYVGNCVFLNGN